MSQRNTDVSVQVSGLESATAAMGGTSCSAAAAAGTGEGGNAGTGELRQAVVDACPLMEVIEQVSGKWSIGILVAAAHGPVRFTELERTVRGISRRMLTLTLRRLERDGLLTRTVYPTVPPRVEYAITDIARDLVGTLTALTDWAERHRTAIAAARYAYDHRQDADQDSAWPAVTG